MQAGVAVQTGFKNRVAVLFNWTVAFLGHGRPQRSITGHRQRRRQRPRPPRHLDPTRRVATPGGMIAW
jgi:hypothetical protein